MADEKPTKPIEEQLADEITRALKHFAPGGKFAPIEDPQEWEKRREALPPEQRELHLALTQFAQLLDYYDRSKIKPPLALADAMKAAAKLPLPERTARIREINQELMKRLHNAGDSASIRM